MTAGNGDSQAVPDRGIGRGLAPRRRDELVPLDFPDAEIARGYVRLTTHLLLQARADPFRTVGFVSAHEAEGTTAAALNVAICLGRTQGYTGRILLVDGDARQRALTRMLLDEGAASEAAGEPRPPLLTLTRIQGVDLLTAPGSGVQFTMFGPGAWTQTFAALGPRYSMILVDCPPILGSAEGLVLPACVDRHVLVVTAGKTSRDDVADALTAIGKDVLGVILNTGRRE